MTAENFCYWLQGFLEIREVDEELGPHGSITANQAQVIQDHLQLVFKKVTPNRLLNDITDYTGKPAMTFLSYPGGASFEDWATLSKEEYKNKYGYDPPASC